MLVIDIGSSSVSAAYVDFGGPMPFVAASATVDIAILSDLSFSRFENEMLRSLHQSIASLNRLRKSSPERIEVYLASPWFASQIRVAKMSRPTPFVVSQTVLNDIVTKELKAFEEEEIVNKLKTQEPVRMIDSSTMQVKLNGYTCEAPINLSGKDLELSIFFAVAPEQLLKKIEGILARDYGAHEVSFSSFISASFVVSRDFFPHQSSYLLVDIGGEVTDVSFVKDGTLSHLSSFPQGRNFLLRRLSTQLKRSIAESVTLCMLYMEDKVESSLKQTCTEILTKAKADWLALFQSTLFSMSSELSVPDVILLTIDGDIGAWFIDAIQKEEFRAYTLTGKEFKIVPLNAAFFHTALLFGENVPRNPFILIEALATMRKPNSRRMMAGIRTVQ